MKLAQRRGRMLILLLVFVAASTPLAPVSSRALVVPSAPQAASLMAELDEASLLHYVSQLSGEETVYLSSPAEALTLATRYSYSPELDYAAQYLVEHYRALVIAVEVQRYGLSNWPNVIATLPGSEDPSKVVILCAHFDDVSDEPSVRAPGADDNASGTAAVLAIADVLAQHAFGYTIRFAHFSGEEQGMLGSKAYAAQERARGTNIVAVLNLDMIAYDGDGDPVMEIHAGTNAENLPIATAFTDIVESLGLPLAPETKRAGSIRASDHSSFWDQGYPAVLVIEDMDDFNPYYHTKADTLAHLDATYFAAITRAAMGATALLAHALDAPVATPTPTPGAGHKLYYPFVLLGAR